jgi:hypothetical protein
MAKPDLQKVPLHLHEEINLVECDDIVQAFDKYANAFLSLENIPAEKWGYRYSQAKWSIKEVVQHIIDAERIFCNRTLVIVRRDSSTPLVSFEEKNYAKNSNAEKRNKNDLIDELKAVQLSSKKLYKSFDDEQLFTVGTVNNYEIDVNTLGFVIIGHLLHHLKIIEERYL